MEYSHNYSLTSGKLWNYDRGEIDEVDVNNNASDGKSVQHKTKILREVPERPT